jgi:hypothetical protein
MPMTVNDLLKLFPKDSEQQINVIYPDNHCMYVPNPGFMLSGKNRDPVLDMHVASLDVEQYTEDGATIVLLVIGVKEE